MMSDDKRKSSLSRVKKDCTPTCHIRLSLRSLTNVSIYELVEADLHRKSGTEEPNFRHSNYATSDVSTFLNVLKSSLGSGLLAMPSAFMNAGLLVGFLGTLLVGFLCAHCTYILVKSSQALCSQLDKSHFNYPETSEAAFQCALKGKFKKYSTLAKQITNIGILLPCYGVGIIYVLTAAATFKQVFENYTGLCYGMRWYVLLMIIPVMPIGTIRQMKYMVPFSAMANLFLLVGVSLTLYFTTSDFPALSSRPLSCDATRLPLFLSTVLFGMEGIGVILPIENAMKNPKRFLGFTGILNCAMVIVVSLSLTMGVFGYVKYGDKVQGSITLNLPDTILAQTVKVLVALAILCTYGLQNIAAAQIIWKVLQPKIPKEKEDFVYYTMRVLIVLGHVISAAVIPQLAPVISLVGALGLPLLGLAMPALLETLTFWEDGLGLWRWRLWKNILLGLAAVVALVSGTWVSCLEITEAYS
ncbi:proton-coupled amino acid transporter-like protein pathetic [Homalodisca vitripennis]|uniref:proton-coupled amino acid transporter-like protein pathetic n=1 Tax=Homalodisca vitripennis TaxID=197043 RepID=UPI001EEAB02B|nr:proton-coupled amino acid transporter-like protein pathetic [Homalodisca vitripennis]XP_046673373.1 proton-coupled amino acid transporter-like protein pathetic [Homalodisca vitripennis]